MQFCAKRAILCHLVAFAVHAPKATNLEIKVGCEWLNHPTRGGYPKIRLGAVDLVEARVVDLAGEMWSF